MNESVGHSGELRSTEHLVSGSFEFGGNRLSLSGTSGLPKDRARMAEGSPVHSAPSAPEQSLQQAPKLMEFGGRKLQVLGTSGPAKERPRVAEGRPIRHDAGSREYAAKTQRIVEAAVGDSHNDAEQLAPERPDPQLPNVKSTGTGHLTGGPVRRA